MYRRERINERDVPESQHTIFIRGLPGSLTTEEIRDFFGKDTGCTFDFVKVSPDRAKLYVAVRFESKTVARQIMDKCTAEGTILGHEVDLTWFRDIRRYLAHCAKQGVRPSRFNNRGRDYAYRGSGRRSRSYTRSPERGPTEGSGENKSFSRSVSRSPSARSLTRSDAHSRSRSKSASSKSSQQSETKSLDYSEAERIASPSPPPKKQKSKKKERKDKKKRKHYSPKSSSPVIHMTKTQHNDVSDMEASDGEPSLPSKYANANQTHSVPSQPQMTITMSKPIGPTKPDSQSFTHRHVTVGSLATNQQSQQKQASYYDVHATATQAKQSQQLSDSNNEADIKFRQTFTVDLDSNASIPKFKSEQPGIVYQPMNGTKAIKDDVISAKRPRVELESLQQPPSIPPTKRESNLLSNNFFKDIQDKILKGFKFKPPTNENKATPFLIMQRMAEEMREEKINKLSVELQECLNNKKRELEQSYRSDCETFGFVTQKLIEKSRALEDPLKVALLEIMKDFKNENMKQFDEFLDQISYA